MRKSIFTKRIGGSVLTLVAIAFVFFLTTSGVAEPQISADAPKAASAKPVDIVRDPADVPPPVGDRPPTTVHVSLTAEEVTGELDPGSGTTYRYWTFNGKVPGPMIRVRQGDTIEVTLRNDAHSHMVHSVDFHAALGPGGGAAYSQTLPGQTKTFTFRATTAGLFVYHCGTPMIAEHMANGMYGLILVGPPGGLPHVDHEFYLVQGEIYTTAPMGKPGLQQFSAAKLMAESPEYFVFNGAVDAVTKQHPMHAKVGDTVRVFFGDAGPNKRSSLHAVGEIFTREYPLGSLTSTPLSGVQTAEVPSGGAAILELDAATPGQFNFMDHAIARMAKGSMATLEVTGQDTAHLMYPGTVPGAADAQLMVGQTDGGGSPATDAGALAPGAAGHSMMAMATMPAMPPAHTERRARPVSQKPLANGAARIDGCLSFDNDIAAVKLFHSDKTYLLDFKLGFFTEHPLAVAQNVNALVELTGHLDRKALAGAQSGSLFAVDSIEQLAPSCDTKFSLAQLREAAAPHPAAPVSIPEGAVTVGMSDIVAFVPATVTIRAGQSVAWKNTSVSIHNVVDDLNKATNNVDVHLPAGVKPFDSGYMQPGQVYTRTFSVPGIYRYVCTLHESSGMKGVVIVRPATPVNMASTNNATHAEGK